MSDSPPPPLEADGKKQRFVTTPVLMGFSVGAMLWLLPPLVNLLPSRDPYAEILPLIVAAWILPPVSVVLAVISKTRRVGLGLLLACGLGWLVLGAMCGGLIG